MNLPPYGGQLQRPHGADTAFDIFGIPVALAWVEVHGVYHCLHGKRGTLYGARRLDLKQDVLLFRDKL